MFRKRDDHDFVVEAVRYGTWNSSQASGAALRIAKFILGVDVDSHTTVMNERVLDVVKPEVETWDPDNGIANIRVVDQEHDHMYKMALGDWVAKTSDGGLIFITAEAFRRDYEDVPPEVIVKSEFDELADLIYDNFPWEGQTYEAVAENVAGELIRRGWKKQT